MKCLFILILQYLHPRMMDIIRCFTSVFYVIFFLLLYLFLILPNYFYKDMKTLLHTRNKKKILQISRDVKNKLWVSLFFKLTFYIFSTLTYSQNCTYYSSLCAIMKTTKCPWWNQKRLNFGPASRDLCVMCYGLELSRMEWREMR